MGRQQLTERQARALSLRAEGNTYRTITLETGLKKSSLSYLFSTRMPAENVSIASHNNKAASSVTAGHLRRDHAKATAGRQAAARERRTEATERWTAILRQHPTQGFIHYIAGLYDGEGAKTGSVFKLCNSDPRIIAEFYRFCREALGLGSERISISIHLHTLMDRDICLAFWAGHNLNATAFTTDARQPRRPVSERQKRDYHGTITVAVMQPLGLREALAKYSVFGGF